MTVWNPGVAGGIPARTTVCRTVNASTYGNGASDATVGIQAAIDACPAGQVVQLSAGTFTIGTTGGYILVNKGITLRGAGPGQTTLQKTNGAKPGSYFPGPYPAPIVIVGPARWDNGGGASTNLASDAVKDAYSVNVASTAGFSAGQFVLLDELSNASWQTDPGGRGNLGLPGLPRRLATPQPSSLHRRPLPRRRRLVQPPGPPHERDQADRPREREHRLLHHPHSHLLPGGPDGPAHLLRLPLRPERRHRGVSRSRAATTATSVYSGPPTPGRRTSTTPPGSTRDFPWPTPSTWRSATPTSTTPSGRSRAEAATPSASPTPPPRPWWRTHHHEGQQGDGGPLGGDGLGVRLQLRRRRLHPRQ